MELMRRARTRLALRTRMIPGVRRALHVLEAGRQESDPTPAPAPSPISAPTSTEVLQAVGAQLSTEERVALTVSCRDADELPKVEGAGQVFDSPHGPVQRMHNGLDMVAGGYFGDWMAGIIETLHGHHEPQEELAFARVLERIDDPSPVIAELGCYWAYYSCWFVSSLDGATAVACEPDPDHLEIGRRNAEINGLKVAFDQCAGGGTDGDILELPSELQPGVVHRVPVKSVPTLVAEHDLPHIDVLHLDIQGSEMAVLESCRELIGEGRIRFVIVSTHHHTISGDPVIHQRCIDFIEDGGGHVIAEHTVLESFSGDGLVVGSFDQRDRDFTIELSRARTIGSLFPAGEQELERMRIAYDQLHAQTSPPV